MLMHIVVSARRARHGTGLQLQPSVQHLCHSTRPCNTCVAHLLLQLRLCACLLPPLQGMLAMDFSGSTLGRPVLRGTDPACAFFLFLWCNMLQTESPNQAHAVLTLHARSCRLLLQMLQDVLGVDFSGSTFVAVSGHDDNPGHLGHMLATAEAMLGVAAAMAAQHEGCSLSVRLGLHTGPITTGAAQAQGWLVVIRVGSRSCQGWHGICTHAHAVLGNAHRRRGWCACCVQSTFTLHCY